MTARVFGLGRVFLDYQTNPSTLNQADNLKSQNNNYINQTLSSLFKFLYKNPRRFQ
jgi:hypothetical protein